MAFTIFSPGDIIKSSETNYNNYSMFSYLASNELRLLEQEGDLENTNNFGDIFKSVYGVLGNVDYDNTTSLILDNTFGNYYEQADTSLNVFNTSENVGTTYFSFKAKKDFLFRGIQFALRGVHTNLSVVIYLNGVQYSTTLVSGSNGSQQQIMVPISVKTGDVVKFEAGSQWINADTTAYSANNYVERNGSDLCMRYISSAAHYFFVSDITATGSPTETEIHLDYDKESPSSIYVAVFSGVGQDASDIGDVEVELFNGASSLGVYVPFLLYKDVSLASTPDKVVIRQNDTENSKISKFIILTDVDNLI